MLCVADWWREGEPENTGLNADRHKLLDLYSMARQPDLRIVIYLNNNSCKIVITTVIIVDTQCKMLLPAAITNATILEFDTVAGQNFS